MGGKVRIYQRPNSSKWQCSTSLNGSEHRTTTKTDSLSKAKDIAEDWYMELRGKVRRGELLKGGRKFASVAKKFREEYEVITGGDRSPVYVKMQWQRLEMYLTPYFGKMGIRDITAGRVQDYRVWRQKNGKSGKSPSRSTMHQEIVTLRQVLKTALRHGWIDTLPDLALPYKKAGKLNHRPWFSPEEYKQLYEGTRERCKGIRNSHHRWANEQLHDLVLFLANTGLRPDEARNLQYRDVEIVEDIQTGETILVIEVRGKRGVGFCKSMPGAVIPFERLHARNNPASTDPVFPKMQSELFSRVLVELGLREDRDGKQRNLYSLRHTYICLRLMDGADIYQIAKNCRTSVEIIEKHYAAHIKNRLDTAAINVRNGRATETKTRSLTFTDL